MNTDKDKNILEHSEVQKLAEIVEKSKKSSRYIALISAVAAIIGITVSVTSVFHLTNQQIETNDSLKYNQILIDSLISKKDSITFQLSKKDSVTKFITEFLTTIKTDSTLSKYYADRVQNYYLRKNLRLDQIKQEKKRFNRDHPRSKLTFNQSDITVNLKHDMTSEVFVNTLYYPDSLGKPIEIIYQIKVNKDNKVYFVRNLEPEAKQIKN